MMRLLCLPAMRQETRLRQAQVQECSVCRETMRPAFVPEGMSTTERIENCRRMGMCPACLTITDAALEPEEFKRMARRWLCHIGLFKEAMAIVTRLPPGSAMGAGPLDW